MSTVKSQNTPNTLHYYIYSSGQFIGNFLFEQQLSTTVDFIFQQDGAPCHTAKVCQKWFKDNNLRLLSWPGNSPDLNPIKNLWAWLKILVSQRRPSRCF